MSAIEELDKRLELFRCLLARYPNTRLDMPDLTLACWIKDTAHLPIAELEACIDDAIAHAARGFVPTSGEILTAFVRRRTAVGCWNLYVLPEEMEQNSRIEAQRELALLRRRYQERQDRALLGAVEIGIVDALVSGSNASREARRGAQR